MPKETLGKRMNRAEVMIQTCYSELSECKTQFYNASANLDREMEARVKLDALIFRLEGFDHYNSEEQEAENSSAPR